ncbi:MAG: pentapeptide repeat-containing protein, partial [Candidatus Omnitrophota bacterium]
MKFSDSRNADFTGARFSGSDLEATMFGGADLTDADLKNCNLRGSIFTGANLEGTDLRGSFLDGADFKTALMKNTKFDKYMGEKLEKYRFQVKYIEDYCEATSPDLDVTRLERLVRDAAIGSIPEFRAKQVAGYFLPYKEMDDDFLIKAIRKCLYEDPYFSISNFDLESKEREALREGIPLIVNEARDEVVVKTYGIGRRAIDLQQVVKMLIDHLEECGKKINIRLIGYDISERSLDFSRYPMKIFIESLPAAWRERISYEVYYGDLKERKCWPMMTVDPLADISIKRHTWIHLEGRESGNTKDERDLEDAIEEGLNTPGVLIVNEAVRMELKVKKAEITDILRRVVLETRDEWEDLGACQVHSQEIVRRLTKEGISAYVAKNDSVRHWWVETEGYVIDAFPEGARGDYKKAARDLGDERFVIVRKSSEVAKRLYQGVEDKKKTAEAKKDAEDDIAFYIRLREHFDNVLRRKGIRLFAVKKKAFIDKVTERLARIEEKLRQLQEGSDADVGVAPFDGTPPPGSPATLLRYMFGYNFKKEKYEAGKAINKKRAKRVVQLVGKRGGNDSPSTVSIEMRVLREAGLIESYRVNKSGQIFYFLPEWALELDPEEILAKVPEFEETNPIAKISKIKRKITHLKRKVVKEAGLSESEEGEAVINTETHSAGMKDRPVMSIRTTLWKVYQMFPDLKITFKWRKSQISITEAPSISDFSPLRDISYKGKMKIIIAGPYAKGTLNKIAALVEKLIHEEKFMQGFSPDGRVIEIGYSIYSGAMLKNEIDTDIKALGMSSTNFGWPKSPPGNPMTLLQYMFGYDFKEGRFVPENLTGRNNPKKSADMVDKRGGKDSPATIRLEVKVLREAGLIEGSGRKGYYIPEWVIEYGLDRVMAEIEELNVPKPKEKQMEAIKDKVDRIKAQISMEEAGTAKFKGPEKKKKKDPAERRVELAKKLKDLKAKLPKGIEATVDVLAEVSEGKLTPQQILNEAKELGIDLAVLGIATKAMPEREKWMRRLRALLLKLPKGAEPTERALAKASKGALTGKQIGEVLHDHNITLGEIGAAGMNEVVLEAETHSGGIHHRPTEALVYICVRLQDILPVAEIIFIGSDETVRIK